jgi:thiol-disulfide isomerase/thioredoxin
MTTRRRLPLLVAALAVTAAVASACTDANGTNGKDYVTGDGRVIQIASGDRGDPVEVSGESLDGDQVDLADLRGKVVVVSVWGAWCPECRTETPLLVDAADELPGDATMVGIDIRDSSKDTAQAFVRSQGMPYPSIYDVGSTTLLEFPPPYNPRDTPSTMILDRQGRMAALIRGELPSKLTLLDLVQDVSAEDGPSDG